MLSTAPPEIEDIRRRMGQIRRDIHEDVRGVVEGAEAATDWRRYIRSYPWASMGVALAVGYLIVPRRHRPTSTTTVHVAQAEIARAVAAEVPKQIEPEKKGKGIVGTLFGMLAPMALRAGQGYALQFFEQWMAQKMAQQMQQHPELAAAFGGMAGGQTEPPERPSGTPQGPSAKPPGSPRF